MDKIINQFRRIWNDDGRNDKNFSLQESRLRAAQGRVVSATAQLVKSSERLNVAALKALPPKGEAH
jgi:hypothetical protein